MAWIICPGCHEIINDPRRYCPMCGYDLEKKDAPNLPEEKLKIEKADEVLKQRKIEKGIEMGENLWSELSKDIEEFLDKKAEEAVKEIRKFDAFVGKKIRNISDNENTGYKLDILDELLEPKDLCQKIVPVSQKGWKHCGCKINRYLVHRIDRESEHQGFLKKVDAGEFIWYCSKECAVKDNQ